MTETSASVGKAELPLVPFERYMLLEDRRDYPMVFVFRLSFRGPINQKALDSAIELSARRHPLLHAKLSGSELAGYVWQPTSLAPTISWLSEKDSFAGQLWQQVDLRTETGLRVWAKSCGDLTQVYFRIHHACCDGMGAYVFFEDVLTLYEALADTLHEGPQQESRLRPLDAALLLRRGEFGAPPTPPPATRRWRDFFSGACDAFKYLLQPPQTLATDLSENPVALAPEEDFLTYQLPAKMLPKLRRRAEQQAASLNDLLLRDLLLTFREWNQQHQFGSPSGNLQIMMPTSLREAGDKELPAANVISYAFLIRGGKALDDEDELLRNLALETKAILRYRYPLVFIGVITHLLQWPHVFRWLLQRQRCFGTAVLTNLGDPTRRFQRKFARAEGKIVVAGAVLQEVIGIPPLRPLTRAVFSASAYAGGLRIGLRCDPQNFSPAATRRLLELFVARLAHSAE